MAQIEPRVKRKKTVIVIQIVCILAIIGTIAYFVASKYMKDHTYIIRNNVNYVSGGMADFTLNNGLKLWLPEQNVEKLNNQAPEDGETLVLVGEDSIDEAQITFQYGQSLPNYSMPSRGEERELERKELNALLEQYIAMQTAETWPNQQAEWRHFGYSYVNKVPVFYGLAILRPVDSQGQPAGIASIYKSMLFLGKNFSYSVVMIFEAGKRVALEAKLNNILGSIVLPD